MTDEMVRPLTPMPLLAKDARYSNRIGRCSLCTWRITPPQRICTLEDGSDAHTSCVTAHNAKEGQ